jgi:hypothetical protein
MLAGLAMRGARMVRHALRALLLGALLTGDALAVPNAPALDGSLGPARIEAAKRLFEAQYSAPAWLRQIERTLMAQFSVQMMDAASEDIMRRTEAFLPELAKRVSEDFAKIMYARAPVGVLVLAERLTAPEMEASLRVVQSGTELALGDAWLDMALGNARFRYPGGEPANQPKPQPDESTRQAATALLDASGMSEELAVRKIDDESKQQLLDDLIKRLTPEDMRGLTAFYQDGTGRKYLEARVVIEAQLDQALAEAEFLIQELVQETCAALGASCTPSIFTMAFYPWRIQRTLGKQP